eukprot:9707689-Alexandrium_andersonii.AAC.1
MPSKCQWGSCPPKTPSAGPRCGAPVTPKTPRAWPDPPVCPPSHRGSTARSRESAPMCSPARRLTSGGHCGA